MIDCTNQPACIAKPAATNKARQHSKHAWASHVQTASQPSQPCICLMYLMLGAVRVLG